MLLITTDELEKLEDSGLITGRATTGIKITQQAILRFVAPQRRHDPWLTSKS